MSSVIVEKITSQELRQQLVRLFDGWEETCIISAVQGVMGDFYAAKEDDEYVAAVAILGDFAFYGGKPVEEIFKYKPDPDSHFMIMVPINPAMNAVIEKVYEGRYKKCIRYAIKKDTTFDRDKLEGMRNAIPEGFEMKFIDEDVYNYCVNGVDNDWCCDWVGNFCSYEEFKNHGLGVAVTKDGNIVAGASSYSYYNEGIEIEIDTKEEYRRLGLATCAAAMLILGCLDKGLYPSWDAANLMSVGLSKKLGYEFNCEYDAYHVNW